MIDEEGHDEESANQICGALQAEAKSDMGNVEELREALERGRGLIADVGVDILSGVGEPAIDSKWTMFKATDDGGHDYGTRSPIVTKADDDGEKRIAYAAAMIPRELDKEGDVVPTPTVEKAAHSFLTEDGGVDTDHSLIEGDGDVVESWVLKQERDFELPDGGSETYPAGTWMVGIKWAKDAWERIQQGDLTGLSIYGMADSVPLGKSVAKEFVVPYADESVVNVLYASRSVAAKAAEAMGFEGSEDEITHPHDFGDQTHYMPAPDHESYVDAYNEFAESDEPLPDMSDGDTEIEDTYKDQEDPCWDGYTMVGTKPNGNPRCVPDDDVEDVDFDKAVEMDGSGPPDGATPTSDAAEQSKQNSMTEDTDTEADDGGGEDGGAEPDLKDLEAKVADLSDELAALKADGDGGDTEATEKADDPMDMIEDVAIALAEEADGDVTAAEIEDDLMTVAEGVLDGEEAESDGMHEGKESDGEDEEDEDDETEKAADTNFGKGGTGNDAGVAAKSADGNDGVPSYSNAADEHLQESD
jgi:archaellum component FlaC